MKSLSKKPDRRFQSGNEMAEALRACLSKVQPPTPKPWPLRIVLFALVILIVAGVGGWVYYHFMITTLNLKSAPSGAQVFLDGESKGETPKRLWLHLGINEISLRLKDYDEWRGTFPIEQKGKKINFTARLRPIDEKPP